VSGQDPDNLQYQGWPSSGAGDQAYNYYPSSSVPSTNNFTQAYATTTTSTTFYTSPIMTARETTTHSNSDNSNVEDISYQEPQDAQSDLPFYCGEHKKNGKPCTRSFATEREYKKHLTHHNYPVKCKAEMPKGYPACEHETADQSDMNRHYWSTHRHWAEKKEIPRVESKCGDCGTKFSRRDNMIKHQKDRCHKR
jgi:hypothetical protein